MAIYIFTCLGFMRLPKRQKLVKTRQKLSIGPQNHEFHPWCLLHCAELPPLAIIDKFDEN